MGKRGPKPAADLAIAPRVVDEVARPDAPYDMTDEQSTEWWRVVNALPADWFPAETHSLLAQYCRHVVASRRIAEMVAAFEADEAFSVDEYDKLLKMQEREGRAMSSLATRLRMTTQATVPAKTAKKPQIRKRPWES